ncbi:MAG: alpha/beta hydrolase [Candidatus Omnitrophota bacterium]
MNFLIYLVIFIVLLVVSVRYIEKRSLFFPMKEVTSDPGSVGLPYEEIYFDTIDNKRLNGWFISNHDARFTVIFSHGNAGNIAHRLSKLCVLYDLGLSIFVYDYRGFGKSEGSPSEAGLYKDVRAAYNYLTKERNIPKENIILYGESLGGAVTIDLAREIAPRAFITEEAFTSIRDMAKIAYPGMPHFVFSSRFNGASKIKDIDCPKLIIHSIDDEIVFYRLGEKLFNEAKPPKEFLQIRGTHTTAFMDSNERFKQGLGSFLDGLKK